jgi:hypothetical protein
MQPVAVRKAQIARMLRCTRTGDCPEGVLSPMCRTMMLLVSAEGLEPSTP